jgi:hypothetical protein
MDRYYELFHGSIYAKRPPLLPGGEPRIEAMYDSPAELAVAFNPEGQVVRQGARPKVEAYVKRWNALFPNDRLGLLTFDASLDKARVVEALNKALKVPGYVRTLAAEIGLPLPPATLDDSNTMI